MGNEKRQAKKARAEQARQARIRAARRKRTTKIVAVLAIIAIVVGAVGVVSGVLAEDASGCPKKDGSSPRTLTFEKAPENCINKAKTYTATFDTSEGKIVVALDTSKTPETVNNFVSLARFHYYDTTQIFRTDTSIDIIQGGAPHTNTNADEGPGYTIRDEGSGYKYAEGDLVMARTSEPNSAGGQFFFATGPKVSALDTQGTYVTFGKTTDGLDVLKKIIGLHSGGEGNGSPSKPVTVNSVTIGET